MRAKPTPSPLQFNQTLDFTPTNISSPTRHTYATQHNQSKTHYFDSPKYYPIYTPNYKTPTKEIIRSSHLKLVDP